MSEAFESWAIVELMGHVKMAGKITEEELVKFEKQVLAAEEAQAAAAKAAAEVPAAEQPNVVKMPAQSSGRKRKGGRR